MGGSTEMNVPGIGTLFLRENYLKDKEPVELVGHVFHQGDWERVAEQVGYELTPAQIQTFLQKVGRALRELETRPDAGEFLARYVNDDFVAEHAGKPVAQVISNAVYLDMNKDGVPDTVRSLSQLESITSVRFDHKTLYYRRDDFVDSTDWKSDGPYSFLVRADVRRANGQRGELWIEIGVDEQGQLEISPPLG